MNINNIVKDLYRYKNEEFDTKFIDKIIKYFNKKKEIINILDNELELSGLKIHLLYTNYKFILSDKIINNYSYRKLNFNEKQINNLLNQKYGLENNNFKICKNIMNDKYYNDLFIIIINNNDIVNEKYEYIDLDLAFVLLGIESLYFLNHQNLDNYCSDIILNNSKKLFDDLYKFKKILEKIPYLERNRVVIFSGLIYHFLGTLYTKDIDLGIFCNNNEQKNKFEEYFKNINLDILYFIKDDTSSKKYEWIFNKLPAIIKIKDIFDILINPKHHFYFLGFKCIDIFSNFISYTCRRANAVTINDTILLKKINNIDYYNIFCIKNFNTRKGDTRIFTDIVINKMFNNVIDIMKKWWNINISIEYLRKHFNKCDSLLNKIDYTYIKYCNKYIKKIIKYNKLVIESLFSKYINNKTIFEIDFNKMQYFKLYNKYNIKYIYGIDSSIYNINYTSKKLNKYNIKYNLTNGSFDNDLTIKKKFNVILLLLCIQNYINSPDIFIKNILSISKPGTLIIITYINGSKIYNQLIKNNKIEIIYKDKLYFSIYPFNDKTLKKVLFYISDLHKYDSGAEEYLVFPNNIIQLFTSNNFKLINKISFLDITFSIKLKSFQKEILSYYEFIIFKKK